VNRELRFTEGTPLLFSRQPSTTFGYSSAKRLNHITDWSFELSYDDLKSYLAIGSAAAIAKALKPFPPIPAGIPDNAVQHQSK
jgi:hypothetical protein